MEIGNLTQMLKNNRTFADNDAIINEKGYTLSDLYPIARFTKKMDHALKVSPTRPIPFTIELIQQQDTNNVIEMLKNFFFKDEPLNAYLKMGECKDLEDYSVKCIKDGCSYKAVTGNGEIIGVLLNSLMHRPASPIICKRAADSTEHPKFKKVLRFMDYIEDNFDIFELYPDVDVILDGKILSVNSNYRGLGISERLTKSSFDFMRDHQIPLMHVLCTSYFSARVMEKMGFHEVYKLNYADYKIDGKEVFVPEEPHKAARILVKKLSDVDGPTHSNILKL